MEGDRGWGIVKGMHVFIDDLMIFEDPCQGCRSERFENLWMSKAYTGRLL